MVPTSLGAKPKDLPMVYKSLPKLSLAAITSLISPSVLSWITTATPDLFLCLKPFRHTFTTRHSCLSLGEFPHMRVLMSTWLNTWCGPSEHLQSCLSEWFCPLWYFVLETLAAVVPPDSQLRLLESGSMLGLAHVPPPCAPAWKPFQAVPQLCLFLVPSLSFTDWYLMTWKPLFYMLCPDIIVVLSGRVNLVPVTPSWLEAEPLSTS